MTPPREQDEKLAAYIVQWLRDRNARELREAFDNMTVGGFRSLLEELAHILLHGGHPPNWAQPEKERE